MSHLTVIYYTAAIVLAVAGGVARADVFLLRSGGQIEGQWTNRQQGRSAGHEVSTASGIRVRVAATQVEERVPQLKSEAEYERIAPAYGPSIDDQWRLAEWCRQNSLPHRRRGHLEAILALDPDHIAARRALGYQHQRGQWELAEQRRRQAGYEMYRGRWRLTQDIEIQEAKVKRDQVEAEWLVKFKRWRGDLWTERAPQAWRNIEEVTSPEAVAAVRKLLAREPHRQVKLVYFDVLLRIGNGPAIQTVLTTALNDRDDEVFFEAADRLQKLPPEQLVKPLLDSLRDQNNTRVNRAAYLLGKIGDKRLASPLIESLVTVHRVYIPEWKASWASRTVTSSSDFGESGSARVGNEIVNVTVENRMVYEALVELTGQNFHYEQRAWRRWYDLEKGRIFAAASTVELRRDTTDNQEP